MKMLKRLASLALCATMLTATVLGLKVPQATAQGDLQSLLDEQTMYYFPVDVEGHWAADRLQDFVYSDIIKGYVTTNASTGTDQVEVRPNNPITRAEFVAILVRALGLTSTTPSRDFRDVKAGQWYYEPIRIASSLGIVNGVNDTDFAPTRPIHRDEIATLVVKAFTNTVDFNAGQAKSFTDVGNYWATTYITQAGRAGIINGYTGGQFKPAANATRAEAVTMLYNSLRKEAGTLPADDALTQVSLASLNETASVISSGNYAGIDTVADKYYTASDNIFAKQSKSILQTLPSGVTLTATPKDLAAQVTQKSDRFAVIKLTGSMEVVAKTPDTAVTRTEDATSTLYLRKVPGENAWKIYHSESAGGTGSLPF